MKGTSLAGIFLLSSITLSIAQSQTRLLEEICMDERPTCFYLYKNEAMGIDWKQAQSMCLDYKARLAAVDNDPIHTKIHEQFGSWNVNAWIGGQESTDDTWRWLDDTIYNGSLSMDGSDYKTCGIIVKDAPRIKIASAMCSKRKDKHICSFDSETDCEQPETELGSKVYIKTKPLRCHILYTNRLTWYEAHYGCLEKGGNLASFNLYDDDNQAQYLTNLTTSARDAWIGLRRWRWRWNTMSSSPTFTYTRWDSGAPSHYNEHCVFMKLGGNSRWGDENCDTLLSYFICQKDTNQQNSTSVTLSKSTTTKETIVHAFTRTTQPPRSTSNASVTPAGPKGNGIGLDNEDLTILIAALVAVAVLVIVVVIAVVLIRRRKKSTTIKSNEQDQGQTVNSQQDEDAEHHPGGHIHSTSLSNVVPTSAYANPNHINNRVDGDTDTDGYAEVQMDQSNRESGINHYAEVTDHSPSRRNGPDVREADTRKLTGSAGQHAPHVNSSLSLSTVDHKIAPDTGDIYRLPDKGHKDNEFVPQNDYELTIRENSLYGE